MSNFLVIDTSSRYLTVAAVKDGETALRHLPDCAMRHSVMLMSEIDKAMNKVGLAPADCDFFAAVTGPGSFTGIRIGVSAANGNRRRARSLLRVRLRRRGNNITALLHERGRNR